MGLYNIFVFLIVKQDLYFKGCRICSVTFLAFFNSILDVILAELEINKFKTELSIVVLDGRYIPENLMQSFGKEPVVGILLNLNKVPRLPSALSNSFARPYRP